MSADGVVITDKTIELIKRLQDDELAVMYAEEAENLIDLLITAQEQYSIIDEKSALGHIKMLRYLAKDMSQFAQIGRKGGAQ